VQGASLDPGVIHVAISDHHLLVERAGFSQPNAPSDTASPVVLRVARGPKENRARPAIDPLFRSAALAFGPRVIAVVLSGALDDGTAGLWAVRDRGGLAVVQDPSDAAVASMPTSAIVEVGADHVAPAIELGPLLGSLVREPLDASAVARSMAATQSLDELRREVAMAALDEDTHERPERYGVPSRFACPDCAGSLWDVSNGRGPLRLRCTVGHAYSAAGLTEAQTEAIEHGMWAAVRSLEDRAELARVRASNAAARGLGHFSAQYRAQHETALAQAAAIRMPLRLDTSTQAPINTGDVDLSPDEADVADQKRPPKASRPQEKLEGTEASDAPEQKP
jgi:two-component system chemotaxis response regulator CheB